MLKIKIRLTAAITIALLIVLALAAFTHNNVSTAASSDPDTAALQEFSEEGEGTVESEEAGSSAQIAGGENVAKVQEQIPPGDRASIVQQVQDLVTKFAEEKIQPGWLHFVYETRNLSDHPSGPLDNGVPIPSDYLMEEWVHLSEEGTAIEVVSSMLSMDQKILQTSVYRNGIWRNLDLEIEDIPDEPVRPALDFAFSNLVKNAPEELTISQRTTQLDEHAALLVAVSGSYEEPQNFGSIDEPVSGFEKRAYFDPNTGALRLLERVSKLADGTERVYLQIIPITVETGVEPPERVYEFLHQWEILK